MADTTASSDMWTSDREEPLTSGFEQNHGRKKGKAEKINESLNTEDGLDVQAGDNSRLANVTRTIASFVGTLFTPRQMLIILRLLKAVTVSFICFTILADTMYIFFMEVFASKEVAAKVGGRRDIVVRVYGLILAVIALLVELEHRSVDRNFPIVKGFIPRGMLLFFISIITSPNPLHESQGLNNDNNNDDAYGNYDEDVSSEIPSSTIVFQMVTSFVLGICALMYFSAGVLCFDRFTSKAFLSKTDPLKATAIPQPTTSKTVSSTAILPPSGQNMI